MSPQSIEKLILKALPGCKASVQSHDGVHYEATVVAEAFANKSLLEQHRMVYAALGDALKSSIHALQLTTRTPEEPLS